MANQTNKKALVSAIEKALTGVSLEELKEYKSMLIDSAVTGEIKVPGI